MAAYERQARQAQKLADAQRLIDMFDHIFNLHRGEFTAAVAPAAPAPEPVDATATRKRHEQDALRGISVFRASARAEARRRAAASADREISQESARRAQARVVLQEELDRQWSGLLANDPEVLFGTLSEAFEDNEAPAAVAGLQGGDVSVVVLAPGVDTLGDRWPEVTAAGNLSLRRLTSRERNDLYGELVCGHVLATVRETLALAPAADAVRVAVVRATDPNAYGIRSVECLLAAVFTRRALQGIQWQSADATTIVNDASADLRLRQSATGELLPMDLSDEPELAALVKAVDLRDLGLTTPRDEEAATGDGGASDTGEHRASSSSSGTPAAQPPAPWQPRPGWGTVRDYSTSTDERGATVVSFRFVPDDGSEPIPIKVTGTPIEELGEFARGIRDDSGDLTIKVPTPTMIDVEQEVFSEINGMGLAQRQHVYALGMDLYEDCGWTWTPDYKLIKAAPGLLE